MTEVPKSEVSAVAEFLKKHLEPQILQIAAPDGKSVPVLHAPSGTEITSLKEFVDEYRTKPERIKGTSKHTTLDSFVAHAVRFSDSESALFAHRDVQNPKLVAVYDYHPVVADDATGVAAVNARFAEHRAVYDFPLSDEWKTWTAAHGVKMTQAQFAEFLENNLHNVADPLTALEETKAIMESLLCTFASPGRLMEIARGLSVRVASVVANHSRLASGEATFRYETQHQDEAGQPLTVPGAFLISIPVFRGGDRYQLATRLRYRVVDAKITWTLELHRAAETFDHAFNLACEKAAADTCLPLFHGQPEV